MLVDSLSNTGIPCRYQWMRFHHFFSLPVLLIARIMRLSETVSSAPDVAMSYHNFYRSRSISVLYRCTLLIDTVIFTIIKVYIPLFVGKYVMICDRFVYDTLVDLMISTGDTGVLQSTTGTLMLNLVPQNAKTIILMADEETLRHRRRDLMHDRNLHQKIMYYQKMHESHGIPIINTSMSVRDVHDRILQELQ